MTSMYPVVERTFWRKWTAVSVIVTLIVGPLAGRIYAFLQGTPAAQSQPFLVLAFVAILTWVIYGAALV